MERIDYTLNRLNPGSRLLDDFTKAATLRDMATNNQYKQLQIQQTQQTMDQQKALIDQEQRKQAAINGLFKQYSGPNGVDNKQLIPALYQVDPDYAGKYETLNNEHKTSMEKLAGLEYENKISALKTVSQVLSGAETPAQWSAAKTFLSTHGLNTVRGLSDEEISIPDQPDPNYINTLNNLVTDGETRWTQYMDKRKQNEIERNNKENNKIGWENAGTSRINANNKGNNSIPEDQKKLKAQEILDKITALKAHPGFKGAVGMKGAAQLWGIKDKPMSGTNAAGFNAQFEALKSLLTLDNLGLLKGVLSDKDMQILTSAATALSTDMSEGDFSTELNRIAQKMDKVLSGQTPGNSTPVTPVQKVGKGNDFDSFWNEVNQ